MFRVDALRALGAASLLALAMLPAQASAASVNVFGSTTPTGGGTPPATDACDGTAPACTPYELGLDFKSTVDGYVTAIRYYRADSEPSADGSHVGRLWDAWGNLLGDVTFLNESATPGWQEQTLATPIAISAGALYTVTVNSAYYVYTIGGLPTANGPLEALGSRFGTSLGYYPTNQFPPGQGTINYFRDVQFSPVPLPAAAWLLLSGLAGFSLLGRPARRCIARA